MIINSFFPFFFWLFFVLLYWEPVCTIDFVVVASTLMRKNFHLKLAQWQMLGIKRIFCDRNHHQWSSQPTLNEILRTAPNICIKPTETNHHRMRNNLLSSDDICFTGMLSKEELYGALERKENLFYSEFFACAFLLVFIFLRFTLFLHFLLMIFFAHDFFAFFFLRFFRL